MKTNWKYIITSVMESNGESWHDVEKCTLTEDELLVEFNTGFGSAEGKPFGVWTKDYVYFPTEYDGAEWVSSVPRNPSDNPIEHI